MYESIEKVIEHLQEIGKVVVNGVENVVSLQEELRQKGYNTTFVSTDNDYLVIEE